ncbi:hypothetical protein MKW94_003872 [Papaver nudicaule]|uniref:Uncharacterized protein n=1 Tax=Papaver nudicaule TaxID=74823 RepID=A0AA41VGW5_PAPNU|nr:hypothetical protein [Papaver nudicaule]
MRFFRRIAGILGFGKDEQHHEDEDEIADTHQNLNQNQHHHPQQQHHHHQNQQNRDNYNNNNSSSREETRRSSKGFGVKVPVVVDRVNPGPLLVPTNHDDGGVQGLKWFAKRLRIDEDGDVADEFFDEVVQPVEVSSAADDRTQVSSAADDRRQLLKKFEYSTKPARVRKQVITIDGKIRQSVEYQGKLQWV